MTERHKRNPDSGLADPDSKLAATEQRNAVSTQGIADSVRRWLLSKIVGLFPDPGGWLFDVPDTEKQQIVLWILDTFGRHPRFRIPETHRIVMKDPGTIIAVLSEQTREALGNPAASLALVSSDPMEDARKVQDMLKTLGYDAEVFENLEHEGAPPNFFAVVKCPAVFGGWVLAFRRSIAEHIRHMPEPEKM